MATGNQRKRSPRIPQAGPEAAKQGNERTSPILRKCGDARFQQLFTLASEGKAEAAADLWREYGFRYGEDEV